MTDGLKSHIRTWWPLVLGQLTTLLVTFLAAKFGVTVDGEVAYAFVSAVVTALVYSLGRWLETRQAGWARGVGRFILSLGLVAEKPSYQPDAAAAELSKAAYTAYGKAVVWKAYNGEPMPAWEQLPRRVQLAWASAALAARGCDLETLPGSG